MKTQQITRKIYQNSRLVLMLCLFVISLIGASSINSVTAQAAPVVGFNPGRIIDDTVFTNANSMSVDQIQAFLNSKVPTCETWHTAGYGQNPPFICLKDFSENGRSAAQIIYDTAQQYQINPQVLIVLLQKEQSLVTDTWPLNAQYRSATGYGCPDTAPCDSQYYGLTNQLKWSGTMFRAIMNNSSTWYTPYVLGNNTVYFNPGPYDNVNNRYFGQFGDRRDITYCGSTVINIQNRSTQALYNYTPYQPNQASLDAGYGSAPPCGAYGNRNFFLYFTDWFGTTYGDLIRGQDGDAYKIENGQKRVFPDAITFSSYSYKWSYLILYTPSQLSQIPNGPAMPYNVHFRDGKFVSVNDGVYLVENGLKRAVPDGITLLSYSYTLADTTTISSLELSKIPVGPEVPYNVHFRDGKFVKSSENDGVYYVENGLKRPFTDGETFSSYSYKWADIVTISPLELSKIPVGVAMPYNVHFRDGKFVSVNDGVYLVENGLKRAVPDGITLLSYSYTLADTTTISSLELSKIPVGPEVPYNVHFRDGKFVKSSENDGVYYVENGLKRPFTDGETFSSYSYKWADIVTISPLELSKIPVGVAMPKKTG